MKPIYAIAVLALMASTCDEDISVLEEPLKAGADVCFVLDKGLPYLEGVGVHPDALLEYAVGNVWKEVSMLKIGSDGRLPAPGEYWLEDAWTRLFKVKSADEVRMYMDCSRDAYIYGLYGCNERYQYKDVGFTLGKNSTVRDSDGNALCRILFISEDVLQVVSRDRRLLTFERLRQAEADACEEKYRTDVRNATRMYPEDFVPGSSPVFSFDGKGIPHVEGYYMSYECFGAFSSWGWQHIADMPILDDGTLGEKRAVDVDGYLTFAESECVFSRRTDEGFHLERRYGYKPEKDCSLYASDGTFLMRLLNCRTECMNAVVPDESSESGYALAVYESVLDEFLSARLKALVKKYQTLSEPVSSGAAVVMSFTDDGAPVLPGNRVDNKGHFELLVAGNPSFVRTEVICVIKPDGHPDFDVDGIPFDGASVKFSSWRPDGVVKDASGRMKMQVIYLHPDYVQVIEDLNYGTSRPSLWVVSRYDYICTR